MIKRKKINHKKTAIIAITKNGVKLANKIKNFFPNAKIFTNLNSIEKIFREFQNIIAIMATGIIIRKIAPLIVSKISDPAVVVIDEKGNSAISLLSGHLGGANKLAKFLGKKLGATPVITTATDINKKFAIDNIAAEFSWKIETPERIKNINLAFLNDLPVVTNISKKFLEKNFSEKIPDNLKFLKKIEDVINSKIKNKIIVSNENSLKGDFLLLRPKNLYIGLGCNRGTSLKEIEETVVTVLQNFNKSIHSINSISSIDLKSDEKGLIDFAEKYKIDLIFYTKKELNQVIDYYEPSEYLIKNLGVKGVCEPSAILSASKDMQKCLKRKTLLNKQKMGNVTIAIQELSFL